MTQLTGISGLAPPPIEMRLPASSGTQPFEVPDAERASSSAARPTGGLAALSGLLALQEAETVPDVREREARRRGRAVLAALSSLQRALLGGGDPGASATRLAATVASMTGSADPVLDAILAAIKLRAMVEVARRES